MIMESSKEYINIYKSLKIDTPVFVFLSLVGIKDHELATYGRNIWSNSIPHNSDILNLTSSKIDKLELDHKELSQIFKPVFDSLCNAYGFRESLNYDDNGNWIAQ